MQQSWKLFTFEKDKVIPILDILVFYPDSIWKWTGKLLELIKEII